MRAKVGHLTRADKTVNDAVKAKRRAEIEVLLCRKRMTISEIAEHLRLSTSTVRADHKALMEEWRAEALGARTEFVMREWKSLDAIERDVHGWLEEAATSEDRIKLVDRLVKIQESRRKLLGLDAPQTFQVLDEDGRKTSDGVIVDLDGLPALIPGPEDREGMDE